MTTTYIELLRHGLPHGEDCFRGHSDFALTEQGLQQMQSASEALVDIDVVVTSPLQRCYQFALQYAQAHQIALVSDKGFMELNFGDWDGQPKQQVWDEQQQALSDFWSQPWQHIPPNGESISAYELRIMQAWQQMLEQYQGQRILLVTHGGVIKQILRFILDLPKDATYVQRLHVPYAGRVCLSVYHAQDGSQWPRVELS